MSERDNGGPAFPTVAGSMVYSHGMTLRDWFAGQAAAAIIGGITSAQISTEANAAVLVAQAAYRIADAMLEARK